MTPRHYKVKFKDGTTTNEFVYSALDAAEAAAIRWFGIHNEEVPPIIEITGIDYTAENLKIFDNVLSKAFKSKKYKGILKKGER